MIPSWLHAVSIVFLCAGVASAAVIAWHETHEPQRMWIMNAVWPLAALFGTGAVLRLYFAYGRTAAQRPPHAVRIATATLHCGAGCALGDICAEGLAAAVPSVLVWLGWHGLFAERQFAAWMLDYLFAFAFGVLFQYFTIAPMRKLSPARGVVEAVKADALSLTAWQAGMYGVMALAQFVVFGAGLGVRLTAGMPEFWFAMQLAMLAGFATSYPANALLIRSGVKEAMSRG